MWSAFECIVEKLWYMAANSGNQRDYELDRKALDIWKYKKKKSLNVFFQSLVVILYDAAKELREQVKGQPGESGISYTLVERSHKTI